MGNDYLASIAPSISDTLIPGDGIVRLIKYLESNIADRDDLIGLVFFVGILSKQGKRVGVRAHGDFFFEASVTENRWS